MKPIHIVFTTINYPVVINELFDNISRFGHLESVKLWVIGDHKTPPGCHELAKTTSQQGLETVYMGIEEQDEWGNRCSEFYSRIPYNNETRRNIGYLCALADDNFPVADSDFIGSHRITGSEWKGPVIGEETEFHNVCEYLEFEPSRAIFPRGFPFRLRGRKNKPHPESASSNSRIGVTAGLWLLDPDVDATTWLNGRISGTRYRGEPIQVLSQNTWTPINTQNTSIVRELIPAFLCIPMGWTVPGGSIQRYGDIWGGYFLQSLMKGTHYLAAFGNPIVEHRRNPHDYIDDLRFEYWGMILTDWLLDLLKTRFFPTSNSIIDRVDELADFLKEVAVPAMPDWCPEEIAGFMDWTEKNLRTWGSACRRFL
jgi:reversibly glycosylated polypeptide